MLYFHLYCNIFQDISWLNSTPTPATQSYNNRATTAHTSRKQSDNTDVSYFYIRFT